MTNSLGNTAALLAFLLCGAPLLAQEAATDAAPGSPAQSLAASAQSSQPESSQPLSSQLQTSQAQTVGASSIRIVRLSQVVGVVQLDRGIGRGFETAFTNLPITQGSRLLTGEGAAEVEFEDNSSLRLTPHSEVEFPLLSLGRDGARTSTVRVREGNIYVSLAKNKENNFSLLFGQETVTLAPAAHIQLAITPAQRRLDVLDGSVQDTNGATTTTVGKKKALLFGSVGETGAPTLVSKNEAGPYDDWDKQAVQYHSRFANSSHYASAPYSYGAADLNYYGSFGSVGGCGEMWRPYLASANWSPYGNGAWAYYSSGYSYVSPYPWGWLPYHSGSWDYCPGAGWGWRPDNQWNGLQNAPVALNASPHAPLGGVRQLKPPLAAPKPLGPTTVAVHQGPVVASRLSSESGTFVFRNDSAGLGVPRGSFGKLGGISNSVMHHGTVERAVFQAPSAESGQGLRSAGQNSSLAGVNRSPVNGRAIATTSMGNAAFSPRSLQSGSLSSGGARSASPGYSSSGYSSSGYNSSSSSFSSYSGGGISHGSMAGSMSGSMSSGGMSHGGSMSSAGSSGGSGGGHH